MFRAITNVFRVAELRARLAYTLALLAVYRLGVFINTPGVDRVAMNAYMQEQKARGGLVKGRWTGVKLLGEGKLSRKVAIHVHRISEKARAAVEAAGGSVTLVPLMAHKAEAASKAHAGKGAKA